MSGRRIAAAVLAIALAACAGAENKSSDASLYERLGGEPAVAKVVDQFVANMVADERLNRRFANADIARLKTRLAERICEAAGGPCQRADRDMATAPKGMKLTKDESHRVMRDLAAALDTSQVPEREKQELLAIVGSMEPKIPGR
jgi:hemoglobin